MTRVEHVTAVWTVDGHRLPFMACIKLADQRTAVSDNVVAVDVRILQDDLAPADRLWLRRQPGGESGVGADLCRAACDALNLVLLGLAFGLRA